MALLGVKGHLWIIAQEQQEWTRIVLSNKIYGNPNNGKVKIHGSVACEEYLFVFH